MDDQKRGKDAADHAPESIQTPANEAKTNNKGDRGADDDRTDGGRAIKQEDLSSANDE